MLRPYKIPVYSLPLHGRSVALLELLPTGRRPDLDLQLEPAQWISPAPWSDGATSARFTFNPKPVIMTPSSSRTTTPTS